METGIKFCPSCGAKLSADAVFCDECGTRQIPDGTEQKKEETKPATPVTPEKTPEEKQAEQKEQRYRHLQKQSQAELSLPECNVLICESSAITKMRRNC